MSKALLSCIRVGQDCLLQTELASSSLGLAAIYFQECILVLGGTSVSFSGGDKNTLVFSAKKEEL